jgi:hypothetical protein
MKYKKLGKLPVETIEYFKHEILLRRVPDVDYQWIHFDKTLNSAFFKIFDNQELEVQYDPELKRYVQKAFYSSPNHGSRIHRDGIQCNIALNIAISCNSEDWVRWYDHEYIDSLGSSTVIDVETSRNNGRGRVVNISDYENISFIDELHTEVGDVYALDVDTYHSFKCLGTEPRIIIQTKFSNYPTLSTIVESLERTSFNNIIASSQEHR